MLLKCIASSFTVVQLQPINFNNCSFSKGVLVRNTSNHQHESSDEIHVFASNIKLALKETTGSDSSAIYPELIWENDLITDLINDLIEMKL